MLVILEPASYRMHDPSVVSGVCENIDSQLAQHPNRCYDVVWKVENYQLVVFIRGRQSIEERRLQGVERRLLHRESQDSEQEY